MHRVISNSTSVILFLLTASAFAQSDSRVMYLANEGVMVTHAETKILIDPLFQNSYGQYQLVPDELRSAMFAGEAPFDGIDAVFVSHHHGDHFTAEDVLRLLRAQPGFRLYAPAQAVAAIREIATDEDASLFERVVGLDLEYGDSPTRVETENLLIEAVHIPHSGWPTARTDVQNLAFRITLDDNSTVLHMGDADARIVHFEADEEYWEDRTVDVGMPPYWFFASEDGVEVIENRINIRSLIGVHAPASFAAPGGIPDEYIGRDIFVLPGEGRRFVGTQ